MKDKGIKKRVAKQIGFLSKAPLRSILTERRELAPTERSERRECQDIPVHFQKQMEMRKAPPLGPSEMQ